MEVWGCWWWCIVRTGMLLNMTCILAPSPLLIEINVPDIHFSAQDEPELLPDTNHHASQCRYCIDNQSSFWRHCNVVHLTEFWPMNHSHACLRCVCTAIHTKGLSDKGSFLSSYFAICRCCRIIHHWMWIEYMENMDIENIEFSKTKSLEMVWIEFYVFLSRLILYRSDTNIINSER